MHAHDQHETVKPAARRSIPAVQRVLLELGDPGVPHPVAAALVRRELAAMRADLQVPDFAGVIVRVREALDRLRRDRLQPVINGTGIILHTNLGRSPLGAAVVEALQSVALNYSNLEYDLNSGARGNRTAYLEHNLALACGAGAAMVVNNCAAALVLMLRHFTAKKPEVIVSRGELVQIGGGFRIPEILEASGATLREVGTTNKTTVEDYAQAIGPRTALLLKVHRSNFFMGGFVASPATAAIAELAHRKRVPLVEDLGSGALASTGRLAPIEHEPTVAEALKAGVNLVCFSGDKLLGGPQAGIIAGDPRHVKALKRHPLFRALRCDKLILAALQTTVDTYLAGQIDSVPVLKMLQTSDEELQARAKRLATQLADLPLGAAVGRGKSQLGGGTLPRSELPSVTLDLAPESMSVDELNRRLRRAAVPVIGYVAERKLKLDLRTIFPRQDDELAHLLRTAIAAEANL